MNYTNSSVQKEGNGFIAIQVINVIIFMIILIGNLLNIIAYIKCKSLRTVSNSFLTSLSVSDLLSGLIQVINMIHLDKDAVFIPDLAECVSRFVFLTSLVHLLLISVDRYIAINDPFHYTEKMTFKIAITLISLTWIIMALLTLSPLIVHAMEDVQLNTIPFYTYKSVILMVCYAIIIPAIAAMYGRILFVVRKQHSSVRDTTYCSTNDDQPSGGSWRDYRPIIILTVLIVATFVFWTPFICFSLYWIGSSNKNNFNTFARILGTMVFANSGLNVFVYASFSKEYRLAYINILRCK